LAQQKAIAAEAKVAITGRLKDPNNCFSGGHVKLFRTGMVLGGPSGIPCGTALL